MWRLAAVGALVCTPAVMQLLGLPVAPSKWVSWSHRLSASLARHVELLQARKGHPSSLLHRLASVLAPLCGPVLLTGRTLGKLLLWRALLRPETWLSFRLHRGPKKGPQPPAEPPSDVHQCFTLISATVADSPQRTHSGGSSRLGDVSGGASSDGESDDCVDAMLQFASFGCTEEEPAPWWQVPQEEEQEE